MEKLKNMLIESKHIVDFLRERIIYTQSGKKKAYDHSYKTDEFISHGQLIAYEDVLEFVTNLVNSKT